MRNPMSSFSDHRAGRLSAMVEVYWRRSHCRLGFSIAEALLLQLLEIVFAD
jgi:hypothetical protein